MSKKYKGKTCAYCAVAESETGDHVVCRNFFPENMRRGLPKAPACERCNGGKSKLEHYLTTLLPFCSTHPSGLKGQAELVRRRIQKNEPLRRKLADGMGRIEVQGPNGESNELLALPFDGAQYMEYLALVVRGLVWWEWSCVVPPDYLVQVVSMTARKFEQFEDHVLSLGSAERRTGNFANGGLTYTGSSAPDDRAFSAWKVDLYDGLFLATDDLSGKKHQLVAGVLTGPPALAETFGRFVEWGSTT